ncbi:MAG: potassium transporter Kup [Rhodospirillaceae bacterium]|nr:MAG: potassium transporter Kup [Rhodospirillaceae bacterium]
MSEEQYPVAPAAPPISHGRAQSIATLMLGAIGVVYGDIGTSPLYAFKECFSGTHPLPADAEHVLGVLSLVFWSVTIVVSFKYTMLMMRADHLGQGGSLALLALVEVITRKTWLAPVVTVLGIFAAALFYGDSMITPAISVLSAVEGLEVALPGVERFIIPITVAILVFLFMIQASGTARIARFFAPVIVVWFIVLAVIGAVNIAQAPGVVAALNPIYAVRFFVNDGMYAFLALGSVVLALTGAEALYADMSHFGCKPIRRAWFMFVGPSLIINYFGQGALLLNNPAAAANPFFEMAPQWGALPMVGLAACATVIASQAVISGAFSVTRQAMQLGFLPRMSTIHTSATEEGQIYIPFVNWTLMVSVLVLVLGFQSSTKLAAAYGVAVTGTMMIDTLLLAFVIFMLWRWSLWQGILVVSVLLLVDLAFFAANITKIANGGWFPLAIGVAAFIFLVTWKKGRALLAARLHEEAMPVETFLNSLGKSVTRVAGTAIFMTGGADGVPHALLHNMKHNKVLHERVIFLTVVTDGIPHVDASARIMLQHLGRRFYRVILRFGYLDDTDVPAALKLAQPLGLELNEMDTSYFLGRETLISSARPGMAVWREGLFAWMSRSATSAMVFFKLPVNRVVELGTQVEI